MSPTDLVVWDSHPLALGATPKQVYIDGIPQLKNAYNVEKSRAFQVTPQVPNYDQEAEDAVRTLDRVLHEFSHDNRHV